MGAIQNVAELCSSGRSELRSLCISIADAGLAALDPARALHSKVKLDLETLVVDDRTYNLGRPVHLLGAGKATLAMAAALEELVGDHLTGGLIVVPKAHARDLERVDVLIGDHPVPGDRSEAAASRMVEYAAAVEPGSLVICTFSGGSSALVSLPPPDVPSAAKRALHELLVGSGLDVVRMNTVRKHVSAMKGGRLAHLLDGCDIVNLTVSDVAGDVLDAITDLTIQDSTTAQDARQVLVESGLWEEVDPAIRAHLGTGDAESPRLDGRSIQTVLVANGRTASEVMLTRARALGLRGEMVSSDWNGEAVGYGRHLAGLAATSGNDVLVGCGGETTVRLEGWGSAWKGGPNQELAVAAGLALDGSRPVAIIALDTDGSDGSSRYAGGLVDDQTRFAWDSAGIDAAALLAGHETTVALESIGQAVVTGPTLTNVNDLFVVVVGE